MKIKKFQKPALKLDKSQEDVKISPEREEKIRASQQAALEELWRNRREYEEQKKLEETNKTPEEQYLDFLDKHNLLFLSDSERQAALDKMGFREIPGPDGVPVISQKPEQPLQSEDADFAMALAGGLGTKAAAKSIGWLPTIAEEIGAGTVGTAATYGSNYLGRAIDNKYGTNITPWLTIGGGLTGAFLGGHWGNRGAMKTAKYTIDNGIRGYRDFHPAIQEEILKTPKSSAEPLLNVGWAPAQTMNIRRAGELDTMYYPSRWDVTNEGANPFGVWLQGKYGVPRTDITNPGKGEKAARARQLFEDRPQYVGNVSFKKPIQTVGEVPDRSVLSYDAERMGADGIIYNNVYDNGWNNNQVIFSFNRPNLTASGKTIDDIPVQTNYINHPFDESDYKFPKYKGEFMNWLLLSKNKPTDHQITVDDLREFVKSLGKWDGNKVSISATDMNLKRNFEDFVDELTQENTYHKALSANDILDEFNLMAEKEIPINPANYAHMSEYFEYDAFPRLMESFKRSGIDLKPEDASYIRRMYSHPFDGIKATIGYTSPGTGGFSRGTNLIRFSNRKSPSWETVSDTTIAHELHHSLRKRLAEYLSTKGYDINPGADWLPESLESWSPSRNNGVRGSYLPSELETMKPLAMSAKFNSDKTPAAEIGAVAAGDARFKEWSNLRKELGRIPTPKELNQRIDNYTNEPFYNRVQQLPYGTQIGSKALSDFRTNSAWLEDKEFLKAEDDFINSMAQSWRDAMKYIGGAAGLTVGLGEINNSEKDKQY